MKLLPLLLILICSTAWAGQKNLENAITQANRKNITLTDEDRNDLLTRGWRKRRPGEFKPPVSDIHRPFDYAGEFHRGSVEYDIKWSNYSFHKVIVPSRTTIKNANFAQIAPNTEVFDRTPGIYGHNLTFINCNLTNVKTYPDWELIDSSNGQADFIEEDMVDLEGKIVGKNRSPVYVAQSSRDVPTNRVKPPKVLE